MPNITCEQLRAAIVALSNTKDNAAVYPVAKILCDIYQKAVADDRDNVKLFDRNAYLASLLWTREDIASALEDKDLPYNKETVDTILCLTDDLPEKIEEKGSLAGWEAIAEAIDALKDTTVFAADQEG